MQEKKRASRVHSIIDSKIKILNKKNTNKWWTYIFESSGWVTQQFQTFPNYVKAIMWMWTRSEWFTRPFFLKFDLAPCCSRKPNPSRNPGTACREEDKNLLTWHWWTNYQTTGKLRRIIIILAHRCWQHNSVISPREFFKGNTITDPPLCCQPSMAFGFVWNNHSCVDKDNY